MSAKSATKRRPATGGRADADKPWLSHGRILLLAGVAAVLLILMNWHIPAEVEISVTATGLQFQGNGQGKQVLLESTPARWLAISRFDEIRVSPASASIADPAKHDFATDTFPASAWSPLPPGKAIVLHSAGADGAITLRAANPEKPLTLGQIFAAGETVALSSATRDTLAVALSGERIDGDVSIAEEFLIVADRCILEGAAPSGSTAPITLRIRLDPSASLLGFSSRGADLRLAVGYPADRKESFLQTAGFAVGRVKFLEQGANGQPQSTLAGDGLIHFVGYADDLDVKLHKSEFLALDRLRGFHQREIAPVDGSPGLVVRMGGVAETIFSGPAGQVKDRRLTYFDYLLQNTRLTRLFSILKSLLP